MLGMQVVFRPQAHVTLLSIVSWAGRAILAVQPHWHGQHSETGLFWGSFCADWCCWQWLLAGETLCPNLSSRSSMKGVKPNDGHCSSWPVRQRIMTAVWVN